MDNTTDPPPIYCPACHTQSTKYGHDHLPRVARSVPVYPAMSLREISEFTRLSERVLKALMRRAPEIAGTVIRTFRESPQGPILFGMKAVSDLMEVVYRETGWAPDRVGLLMWMAGEAADYVVQAEGYGRLGGEQKRNRLKASVPGRRRVAMFYDRRAEEELHRIAQLPEPARTTEGALLIARWKEARLVAEGLVRLRRTRAGMGEGERAGGGKTSGYGEIPPGAMEMGTRAARMLAGKDWGLAKKILGEMGSGGRNEGGGGDGDGDDGEGVGDDRGGDDAKE